MAKADKTRVTNSKASEMEKPSQGSPVILDIRVLPTPQMQGAETEPNLKVVPPFQSNMGWSNLL